MPELRSEVWPQLHSIQTGLLVGGRVGLEVRSVCGRCSQAACSGRHPRPTGLPGAVLSETAVGWAHERAHPVAVLCTLALRPGALAQVWLGGRGLPATPSGAAPSPKSAARPGRPRDSAEAPGRLGPSPDSAQHRGVVLGVRVKLEKGLPLPLVWGDLSLQCQPSTPGRPPL